MPRFGLVFCVVLFCSSAFAEQQVIWPVQKRVEFLRRYYSATESSYFIDLWESQSLASIVAAGSLCDTRTLFINAHGKQIKTTGGKRYVLYPHEGLLPDSATPVFYLEDLARVLGPTNATRIHNIVLSACNVEGA